MIQKIVAIGDLGLLGTLENSFKLIDCVVFLENYDHGYSRIKAEQPQLVFVCINGDLESNPKWMQVLSMLKLDRETRDIPLLTFTANAQT